MKLPPELMDKIFKEGESNPRNVTSFGKLMSKKTKQKMINCTKVIDTGDLKKVRLLKFHSTKCTHNDLLYSLDKGYYDIARYIHSSYPEARIKYTDISNSVIGNQDKITQNLLEVYKFNNPLEYIQLFSLVNPSNKRMMKVLIAARPNKRAPLLLSKLFGDDLNFLVINIGDYFKNFMSVATNIIVDDLFVAKMLLAHEFTNLNVLFKYQRKKINRKLRMEIMDIAADTLDFSIIEFMEKNKDIF